MNEQPKTIDVTAEATGQALQRIEPQSALPAPAEPQKPAVTAAQAKIEAIANLTAAAYAKASELRLSAEESAALQAPFADEDFCPGAAGKEHLIYIQHSALRDRFNKVLGLGQWTLIPRSRWAQDDPQSSTVYVEAMLLIRGCFVAESIGDMVYWPKNKSTNYGDAVEGATTQAFRRCAKMFGVGLQAWNKSWCEGWWARRLAARKGQAPPAAPPQAPFKPASEATVLPEGEVTYNNAEVKMIVERHSKPDAPKKWTAFFITFSDGQSDQQAATFDKKVAELANELTQTGERARIVTRPGRKQGSRELVSLEPVGDGPPPESSDNVPMDFDKEGNPVNEVIP